jgi:ADP-ribose pyrophosphatase YjhB (NUDIX family)
VSRRIDYYDDPDAPEANSLVPSVNVVVVNERDEVLFIRRTDNGNWAIPGGAVDLGESVPDSDPKHIILYTCNGEARQEFSIVFTARVVGGELRTSDESSEVRWVEREEIAGLTMDPSMRKRVERYLSGAAQPHIG